MRKMGTKLKLEWTLHHGKPHQVKHTDELLDFAEQRESILSAPISSKEMRPNLTIKLSTRPLLGNRTRELLCRPRPQTMFSQPVTSFVLSTSVPHLEDEEKKPKRLCFNCMGSEHQAEPAPIKNLCIDCGARRHTILHQQQQLKTDQTGTKSCTSTSNVTSHCLCNPQEIDARMIST